MGYRKFKRPIVAPGVQTLTSASTGTTITNYGLTSIIMTTAGSTDVTFKLAAPKVGVAKTILFSPGARTVTFTSTATGTDPFLNSTNTTSLVATSDADDYAGVGVIELFGATSVKTGATGTKWGVVRLTTAISIT